jgi:hypothetical protein
MLVTIATVVTVATGIYEVIVRAFPTIPIKYSIIQKILNLLSILSNALNNKSK